MKITINADDFGISPGVNLAVEKMFHNKKLNSANIICGCDKKYFDGAIKIAKENPDLEIGLHFNLSTGKSISAPLPLLTNEKGEFKNGFVKLLLLSIFKRKELLKEVQIELEAQINFLQKRGIKLQHINSHRHIHFIPGIFLVVVEIAKKYQIKNIRVINESLISTLKINHPKIFLLNGGIVKWLVLRFLGLFNGSRKYQSSAYFFSILYSCTISKELINKIEVPKNFDELEIMIHPGNPVIDKKENVIYEKNHLLSNNRLIENLL